MKVSLAEKIRTLGVQRHVSGALVGRITGMTDRGEVLVDFPGNNQGPIPARFAMSLHQRVKNTSEYEGRNALILLENDDPEHPIIVDLLCESVEEIAEPQTSALQVDRPEEVLIDGRRITFDAKEEIMLCCGKASITLTRAGKVLIKGAYLLTRSSGVNRIKGASVQIN